MLYADETPARAAGNLRYVHVACTEFLTAMHTGDRTSQAIGASGILPGYAGTIVRDGYKGYEHLTDALHAWCIAAWRHIVTIFDAQSADKRNLALNRQFHTQWRHKDCEFRCLVAGSKYVTSAGIYGYYYDETKSSRRCLDQPSRISAR